MKTLKRTELPKCDICKGQTDPMFDVPTIHTSWASLCTKCLHKWGGKNKDIGYKIVKVNKPEPKTLQQELKDINPFTIEKMLKSKAKAKREKDFAASFDADDPEVLEDLLMDSVQPTACPEGCEVEPDGKCCHGYSSISILLDII